MYLPPATPIIIWSALTDKTTFKQAQEVIPLAYVTKPLDETSLQFAIELAIAKLSNTSMQVSKWEEDILLEDHIFVKVENKLTKIIFDDILWVEVEGKFIKMITKETSYFVKIALKELERKLPKKSFVRIHRNYLISINHLKDVATHNNTVRIAGNDIPIGNSYKGDLINKLNLLGW